MLRAHVRKTMRVAPRCCRARSSYWGVPFFATAKNSAVVAFCGGRLLHQGYSQSANSSRGSLCTL